MASNLVAGSYVHSHAYGMHQWYSGHSVLICMRMHIFSGIVEGLHVSEKCYTDMDNRHVVCSIELIRCCIFPRSNTPSLVWLHSTSSVLHKPNLRPVPTTMSFSSARRALLEYHRPSIYDYIRAIYVTPSIADQRDQRPSQFPWMAHSPHRIS